MIRTLEQQASDATEYIVDAIAASVDMARIGWTSHADEIQLEVYTLTVRAAHIGQRVLNQRAEQYFLEC